jgi:hypothetical protein
MLRRQRARHQDALGEYEKRERERTGRERLQVTHWHAGQRWNRYRGGNRREVGDAARREIERTRGHDGDDASRQGGRHPRSESSHQHDCRDEDDAEGERGRVCFRKRQCRVVNAQEEFAARQCHAEEDRKLRCDQDQRGSRRVSDEHRRGQEVRDVAQLDPSRNHEEKARHDRERCGKRRRARGVTGGQWHDHRGAEKRDRRIGTDDDAAGGREQRENHHRTQRRVEPGFGPQAGKLGVREHRRDHHDAYGQRADDVAAQRAARVRHELRNAGKPPREDRGCRRHRGFGHGPALTSYVERPSGANVSLAWNTSR